MCLGRNILIRILNEKKARSGLMNNWYTRRSFCSDKCYVTLSMLPTFGAHGGSVNNFR